VPYSRPDPEPVVASNLEIPKMLAFLPSIGPMEALIIGGVALLIFGNRLPSVARSVGKSLVEFKKGMNDIEEEVKQAGSVENKTASKSETTV
jgi:sec-independent protein translocase protein TatA